MIHIARTALLFTLVFYSSTMTLVQDLAQYKWKNRIVIVKTEADAAPKYMQQLEEFRYSIDELTERKLVLYQIVNDQSTMTSFKNDESKSHSGIAKNPANTFFDEREPFEVLLIGLDGQVKLQQTDILTRKDLFGIIDSMPMRRNEIKNH